jgi:hypothetical protein
MIPRNDMENPEKLKHKAVSCLVADYIQPSDQCDALNALCQNMVW